MRRKELPYTNDEIVRLYWGAKDKSKEIQILADLNCCTPATIKKRLQDEGIELQDGRKKRKEGPEAEEETEPKEEIRPSPEKEICMELPKSITMEIILSRMDGLEEEIRYHKKLIDNSVKIIAEREILYNQLSEIVRRGSI